MYRVLLKTPARRKRFLSQLAFIAVLIGLVIATIAIGGTYNNAWLAPTIGGAGAGIFNTLLVIWGDYNSYTIFSKD